MMEYFVREAFMHAGRELLKLGIEKVTEKRNEQKQAEQGGRITTCTGCGQPLCKECLACHNRDCWAATL